MAIQNIINASARLDKANQYNPFEEGIKQIEKGFNAMATFEKQQNEKANKNLPAYSSIENFLNYQLQKIGLEDQICMENLKLMGRT